MKGCRPLTDYEIESVLLQIHTANTHPERDKALFLLGLRTGFRISELLSLKVEDVFQNGNYVDRITVQRKNMKGKQESRCVSLHAEARDAIKALILKTGATSKDFLFKSQKGINRHITRVTALEMLKKAYAACGMTGKLGTHSMRKTFAKGCYELLGKDLLKTQKALNHKSVTSTASYLSFAESEIDDAILNLGKKPAKTGF